MRTSRRIFRFGVSAGPFGMTQAGVAFSDDGGKTWNRGQQRWVLPPTLFSAPWCYGVACGILSSPPCDTECATSLAGDPWLATNGSRVLLVNMAQQHGASYTTAPTAVVVSRSDDGSTWSLPRVVGAAAGIDKPNVSFVGFTAAVTYSTFDAESGDFTGIKIVTSDDEGATWSAAQTLDLDFNANQPIIKLTGPRTGYLSYSLPHRARVARLTRDADTSLWSAETILERDKIDYPNEAPVLGGSAGDIIPTAYRRWRDAFPFSFDVGNIDYQLGTAHLYFAFRERSGASLSSIFLFDCRDGGSGSAEDCGRVPWRRRTFRLTSPPRTPVDQQFGMQFQPIVAAGRIGGDVAVAWYQLIGTFDSFNRQKMTVYARRSTDDGETFDAARPIDPRLWSACVAKEPANSYYGDYIGMVIPTRLNTSQPLSTVTLYASSVGGCVDQDVPVSIDARTFDQHVESATW